MGRPAPARYPAAIGASLNRPQVNGSLIDEFDLRLKKSTDLSAFIREIEESNAAQVAKVELKQQ